MDIALFTLFIITCVLLVLVVLLQKGRGGGLGAAFGGAGSSAFGTRTGDVLTWVTIVLTAMFLILAVFTSITYRPEPGTVMAPVFNPTPGPVEDDEAFVTVESGTPRADIFYTLDGSEPTEESKAYESAIRITEGTTLKARGFRPNWKPSVVAEGYYGQPETKPAESEPEAEMETPATDETGE